MATPQLLLLFIYQGLDAGAPGIGGAGASISVSFDNGTIDPGFANCNFSGVLGEVPGGYPVVQTYVWPQKAVFAGNINTLNAQLLVDAASTPLTGTLATDTALMFDVTVTVGIMDQPQQQLEATLPAGKMSIPLSLTPPTVRET